MIITVKEVVLNRLGGIVKKEVYVDGEYFGTGNNSGDVLLLIAEANKLVAEKEGN